MSNEMVKVTRPIIDFHEYEVAKTRAKQVAEYINSIEVDESNIKFAKQELAEARKLTGAIEDRRKEIKNEILEPYKAFELQVKEIVGIVDDADSRLRSEVRRLEDEEKERKEKDIQDLWEKRVRQYSISDYVPNAYDFFFKYRYLNKTVSMKSIEKEMTDFLEDVQADVDAILKGACSEDVMVEYAGTLNIRDAIENVRKANEYKDSVFEADEEKSIFVIRGKLAIKSVELFCRENGINFEIR